MGGWDKEYKGEPDSYIKQGGAGKNRLSMRRVSIPSEFPANWPMSWDNNLPGIVTVRVDEFLGEKGPRVTRVRKGSIQFTRHRLF